MHESIKMEALGALWGNGQRWVDGEREEKSDGWHSLRRREMEADRGKGEERRGKGAECSFKWKLAFSLMAGTSNDDPPPTT